MEHGIAVRARGLGVLRGVLGSAVVRDFLDLLGLLEVGRPDPGAVAVRLRAVVGGACLEDGPPASRRLAVPPRGPPLDDENPFSLGAERGRSRRAVLEQARLDLRTLRELFDLDAETLLGMVEEAVPGLAGIWVPWTDPTPRRGFTTPHRRAQALRRPKTGEPARSSWRITSPGTARGPSGATGLSAGGREAPGRRSVPTR